MILPVGKLDIGDAITREQSHALVDRINQVADVPILQGRLIEGVSLKEGTAAGPTRIRHGLGRKLRGWIMVKNNISGAAGSFVYDSQVSNKNEDEELWLFLNTGSTTVTYTVSLWVF